MFGIHLVQQKEVRTVAIPSSVFQDRNLAPLEAITLYLKDEKGMSYHEIAILLNRNDRTIWTCYHRAKKKTATGGKT
ncbi:sigma-70 region 4 domain-containing protein [Candidatus Woesearchaeota archaeon]|nr:sigma-70 region 4 domain-containing protein [Candidatus Woesearchaeota archaeon]